MIIKAIVTTLDNLPILKQQCAVLKSDPLIDETVVVINGSIDGSKEWIDTQSGLTVVYNEENKGASIGRNSGLDVAGHADYFLMLDGGIRPLRGGVAHMLDYLERTPECGVIGLEIADLETDESKAWRRWVEPITNTYVNTRLSHTAYCLARYKAFDKIRFCTEGPFGIAGHAAEDDELAYQWIEAGINVHIVTGVHAYRRASGSHARLFKETGVYPNQYGSVYEQRVVWLAQNWPQHEPPGQWGEPWITVVIEASEIDTTAKLIKSAHDQLRTRRFEPPWDRNWNPYHIVVWGNDPDFLAWAERRRLRQHHGDTIIAGGEIVRRNIENESTWTGDFIVCTGDNWHDAVRPNAHYYGLVTNQSELDELLAWYDEVHPPQPVKKPPGAKRVEF